MGLDKLAIQKSRARTETVPASCVDYPRGSEIIPLGYSAIHLVPIIDPHCDDSYYAEADCIHYGSDCEDDSESVIMDQGDAI